MGSDGYLALSARLATMFGGTSQAPILLVGAIFGKLFVAYTRKSLPKHPNLFSRKQLRHRPEEAQTKRPSTARIVLGFVWPLGFFHVQFADSC